MSFLQKIGDFFKKGSNQASIRTNDSNFSQPQVIPISDFTRVLKVENVKVDSEITNKNELLKYLVDLFQKDNSKIDSESLYGSFLLREQECFTDLGDGFAVPHAQDGSVDRLTMGIVTLKQPVDWGNGNQVRIVLALIMPDPEKNYQHVSYLSSIARLLSDPKFVHTLKKAADSERIAQLFLDKSLSDKA